MPGMLRLFWRGTESTEGLRSGATGKVAVPALPNSIPRTICRIYGQPRPALRRRLPGQSLRPLFDRIDYHVEIPAVAAARHVAEALSYRRIAPGQFGG